MALLSSSSSSSITYTFTYDVFLSFRGADTRHGFIGNLYKALCDKGIHTFIDDEKLQKGDEITPALEAAIEKSRIAIIVLSKNYASSSFCLHELSKILDCFKENCRFIWPVFYNVDPSDVRKQTGTYGEAMTLHMERFKDNKEKLQKWRTALQQVADLSGWHFKHGDGYEHKFIGKIVKEVSRKINCLALPIADDLVGLESQVRNVISLLDVRSNDRVHMVGIHGTSGIGKTTLALAIYNSIADHFEGLCFLENIRENSNTYGLLHLQKTFLLDVLGEKKIELTSVKQGISIIQRRLQQKKILLILDDVDKEEQLKDIVGRPSWFGPGSRIIITTRDKHLLACYGVEKTYEVEGLNKKDAIKFLTWKAFKNDKVKPSYVAILDRAVAYASGLPLALEVIGSNLYGKSIKEWESALEQYERIPNKKIQKILKVSFDALEEEEQSVFLDIACCFKGYHFKEVKNILNVHHGQCIKYQIQVLVDKSLIKITHCGEVTLHDLIEDMGKEIVRQESQKMPGKRSRLWSHKDTIEILEENTGTNEIEMIYLDFPLFEEVQWDGKAFKKMKNLKTLIIKRVQFSKGPKHLPNSLRVLEWWKYPSEHLPFDFHPKKLSICKLPGNCLTLLELLNLPKEFVNIKVLNFEDCQYLTHIHDMSSLLNLEEFSFMGCDNLVTIHNSVGLLNKLKILDARDCCELRNLPPLKLPSLKELELSGCSSLESFPEILEDMENITTLNLRGSYIRKFPSSFRNLTRLKSLHVNFWLPIRSFITMPELATLVIDHYKSEQLLEIKEEDEEKVSLISTKIEHLSLLDRNQSNKFVALVLPYFDNLKELDLRLCHITSVPECIKECRYLLRLVLDYCRFLREIKAIPPSLKYLSAQGCGCLKFSSRRMLLKQELHVSGDTFFRIPSPKSPRVPKWFEHRCRGPSSSVSFWFRNNFPHNILLCLVSPRDHFHSIDITVNGKECIYRYRQHVRHMESGHACLLHLQVLEEESCLDEARLENVWNHVEVVVEEEFLEPQLQVILDLEIGIHVLKEKGSTDDIQFTSPDCEENFEPKPLLSRLDSDLEENERDESSNCETPPYDDFNFDSSLSSTHSDVDGKGDESSNCETQYYDFNSESSLSNTHSDEENERDESSNYVIGLDDFNSESSLSSTGSDVEENEGHESSYYDT